MTRAAKASTDARGRLRMVAINVLPVLVAPLLLSFVPLLSEADTGPSAFVDVDCVSGRRLVSVSVSFPGRSSLFGASVAAAFSTIVRSFSLSWKLEAGIYR
jgi:hypothetical protein